jgi:DNA-binding SARP family transcriptional activator
MVKAQFALDQGEEDACVSLLSQALALGKDRGYLNAFVDQPSVTARLCVKALEAGIEEDYVQDLIRKRKLIPHEPPLHLENWPWPVKVYTLGRFALVKDGEPLRFSGKAQRKPLSLLKAIIALGGREVQEERVADALWPEVDGDMAHQSLATTLHRLRKLIGYQEAVQLQDGRLTLDPRYCWVDTWAFERMLGQADGLWKQGQEKTDLTAPTALASRALELYHGDFLVKEADDSWTISHRERLRSKFLRGVETLGNRLESVEQWEQAADLYRRGLEVDNLAETFYRRLMVCYHRLDRRAEALVLYDRCKKALLEGLGIDPSPKTESIYQSLLV